MFCDLRLRGGRTATWTLSPSLEMAKSHLYLLLDLRALPCAHVVFYHENAYFLVIRKHFYECSYQLKLTRKQIPKFLILKLKKIYFF